jgi:hypothetical protein
MKSISFNHFKDPSIMGIFMRNMGRLLGCYQVNLGILEEKLFDELSPIPKYTRELSCTSSPQNHS